MERHTDDVAVSLEKHERPVADVCRVRLFQDVPQRKLAVVPVVHQGKVRDEAVGSGCGLLNVHATVFWREEGREAKRTTGLDECEHS